MKKLIRFVLVSALTLISFSSFSQTVGAATFKRSYVHTLKTARLYAAGKKSSWNMQDWFPKYEFSQVTDRALSADTDWYTDEIASSAAEVGGYHRVATNEWAKSSDVVYVNQSDGADELSFDQDTQIYSFDADSYQIEKTDKTLPAGKWLVGATYMTFPDGVSYAPVGANEWIKIYVR